MSGSTTATKHLSGESLAVTESSTWHGTSSNRGLQILILKLPDLWTLRANPRRVGKQSEQKHRRVSESGGKAGGKEERGREARPQRRDEMCGTVCELSCATAARAGDDAASLVPIPLLFSSLLLLILFSFVWTPLVFQGLLSCLILCAASFLASQVLLTSRFFLWPNQTKPEELCSIWGTEAEDILTSYQLFSQ